jgi:preprotein translocase subunit SecD
VRKWPIFAAAGAVILVAAGWGAWRLWRDPTALLGGTLLVYQVDTAHPVDPDGRTDRLLERTVAVVRARADKLTPLARVAVEGTRVTVRAPVSGADLELIKRVLPRTARLELVRVDDDCPVVSGTFRQVGPEGLPGVRWAELTYGGQRRLARHLVSDDLRTLMAATAELQAKRPLASDHRIAVERFEEEGQTRWRTHCLFRRAEVTDEDIADADVGFDNTGRPVVEVTFSAEGARRLDAATGAWIDRRMAIVLEGRVIMAPVITSKISERAQITLGAGAADPQREVKDLVSILRTGSLPAPLVLVEEHPIERHH